MHSQSNIATSTLEQIQQNIKAAKLHAARNLAHYWLQQWIKSLNIKADRNELRKPDLWTALSTVVEHTHDDFLAERFWQALDTISPKHSDNHCLPLMGVPILNRFDLLEQLLDSIDLNIKILAIVDNSPNGTKATSILSAQLEQLRQTGHPLVEEIRIARPFENLGVAGSWNLILQSFPNAAVSLLVNNDIRLAPGRLSEALKIVDPSRPQFLPLLPVPQKFSAFLITAKAWDRVGLFDTNFYPAYCEDLDYYDRLRADPEIEILDGSNFYPAMSALNIEHSQTIKSDPDLNQKNRSSYALNKLWYLSNRRIRGDCRGTWVRRWLNSWDDE